MPILESPTVSSTKPFIRQSRVIRAPRHRVFEAWTNPDILKQWFGPAGMFCPSASLDVREGGSYRIDVHPSPESLAAPTESGGRRSHAEGVYTEVIENEKLQFTWQPSWNPGEQSLVTVSLRDADGGTEVTILHEKITSDGADGYTRGWSGSLEKLAGLLG